LVLQPREHHAGQDHHGLAVLLRRERHNLSGQENKFT